MQKKTKILTAILFGVLCWGVSSIAEEITLKTYYPAPYGAYEALLSNTLGVGDNDGSGTLEESDVPTDPGDVWIAGNLGIGTLDPSQKLYVNGNAIIGSNNVDSTLNGQGYFQEESDLSDAGYVATPWVYARAIEGDERGSGATLITVGGENGFTNDDEIGFVTNGQIRMFINTSGVGIGNEDPTATLHVNGNIKAVFPSGAAGPKTLYYNTGTNEIHYSNDLAELFETTEVVEVGDVLVIDETIDIKLRKSRSPYEKSVAGIASGSPAILFEGSQLEIAPAPGGFTKGNKPPVALAGRILCKVSVENGPIERGDLLTTSSTPGHAMKVTDRLKALGAIVGKALEPFEEGPNGEKAGKIMVLVTLQ